MSPRGPCRLGLVGHPIGASLSPVMHEAALAAHGLAGEYVRLEAADEVALAGRWRELLTGARDGVNVTLPWKLEAAALCRAHGRLEGVAARLGAVNTIAVEGPGRLVGHNTDVPGLVAALVERWPGLAEGARETSALVVGAGGAAYAALMAAHELGFGRVWVWNRTAARAHAMVASVGLGEVVAEVAEAAGASLVLQAGSHGMGLEGEAFEVAVAEARVTLAYSAPGAKVMDLVYRPRPTAWVRAARELGREADDGLAMLVHQAALAFALWTGEAPPVEVMRAAAEAELARRAASAR